MRTLRPKIHARLVPAFMAAAWLGLGGVRTFGQAGFVDPTFVAGSGAGGLANSSIRAVLPVSDGKTLVAGLFSNFNGQPVPPLVRIHRDGSLDPTFIGVTARDLNFILTAINTLQQQPDSRILVGGGRTLSRLNADGTRDPGFTNLLSSDAARHSTAVVNALALQPDGKIVAGFDGTLRLGSGELPAETDTLRNGVARFNADGSFDPSFDIGSGVALTGNGFSVNAVAVDSVGRILVGGNFNSINGTPTGVMARLFAQGGLDPTFALPSVSGGIVGGIFRQPDGQILVTGSGGINGAPPFPVRLNPDGTVESAQTFHPSPIPAFGGGVVGIGALVQSDGKIVLIEARNDDNGVGEVSSMRRLMADGSADPTFNLTGGMNLPAGPMALDANGDLIVAGSFTQIGGVARSGIARILTQPAPQPVAWYRAEGNFGDAMLLNPASSQTAVTFVPGAVGQAFSLASPGYVNVTITDSPSLKPAPVMSFAFFARQLDPNQPAPIFSKNDYRVGFYGTQVSGGRFIAFIAGGRNFGVASPGDTNWHHFTIVVTNGAPTPAFYIDGMPQNLLPGYKDGLVEMRSSDDPLVLVSDQPGTIELDELQIYRVGLTAPQVAALAAGVSPEPANALTVASYAMPNGGRILDFISPLDFHDNSYTGGTGDPTVDGSALAGGVGELTDGVQGLYSIHGTGPNQPWVVWKGISPVITFDFGGTRSVTGLRLTVEVELGAVTLFRYFDASFSDDGVHFGPAQRFFPDAKSAKRSGFAATLPFELIGLGRYARLALERIGESSPALSEVSFLGYTPEATKPHFVTEPADLAGHQGEFATLESFAEGVSPLTYQWRRNGDPIVGATNRQLSLSYPYPADSGAYTVVALNALGATTSRVAQVTISPDIVPGAFDHSFLPPVDDSRLGFLTNFTAQVNIIVRQTDGKLLLGGNPPNAGGSPPNSSLIRLNPDGTPDPSFVPQLPLTVLAVKGFTDLAVQADGKIIFTAVGYNASGVVRLNPDGSPDATFNNPEPGGYPGRVLVLPDGALLVGGEFGPTVKGLPRSNLMRLRSDGTVDPDFAPAFNAATYDFALDIEGNYLDHGILHHGQRDCAPRHRAPVARRDRGSELQAVGV